MNLRNTLDKAIEWSQELDGRVNTVEKDKEYLQDKNASLTKQLEEVK